MKKEEIRITYKRLKGIRSRIKCGTKTIKKALISGKVKDSSKLEEEIYHLTKNKTRLRKKFEKLTGVKGPYSKVG